MNLADAVVYDIETLPNVFTLTAEPLYGDWRITWEISEFRDDRGALISWFEELRHRQTPMIGFNNLAFDYVVIHFIYFNPQATVRQIYEKAMEVINDDRFASTIWASDRFAPQIDLFKIHHFDNKAKTISLKALQINMRSPTVVDSPVEFGTNLTFEQIQRDLIPYNCHDVQETKRFAFYTMKAIEFRIGLIDQFDIEVLNYNDVKIGVKMLEKRIGEAICYDRSTGRKLPRQTPRYRIALGEIIFGYIAFTNPEFARVHQFMLAQILTPDDLEDPDAPIRTKGAFTGLNADVGGLTFDFGTGGVHASVKGQRFTATEEWLIRDIDVEGLYPNIAIVNQLAPEHLGDAFIAEYSKIPIERKTHKKGTYQNAALKLAANGAWGQSNNKYSVFFDPKYAMTIPINGQLLICMLAEWLVGIPTLQLIQANTDGITYRIHRDYEPLAVSLCRKWEAFTCLKLEDVDYSRMWIRDVNNYVAEDTKGKLKQKGAYWFPDPMNYADSISQASPPCWYKDLGAIVTTRAAVAAMVQGIDPETFIRAHSDPFDFMCRAKVDRSSHLMLGAQRIQRVSRYYVARNGAPLIKVSPPVKGAQVGDFKRRSGLTDMEYNRIAATVPPGQWDERIHTKNKSRHEIREMSLQAGWNVAECNDASKFRFDNVNYDFYVTEARKLIIT